MLASKRRSVIMAEDTIDELQISIESQTKGFSKTIQSVIKSLNGLSNAIKSLNITPAKNEQLQNLGKTLKKFKSIDGDGLRSASKGLQALSNSVGTISSKKLEALNELPNTLTRFNRVSEEKMKQVAEGLQTVANVDYSKVDISKLQELTSLISEINKVTVKKVSIPEPTTEAPSKGNFLKDWLKGLTSKFDGSPVVSKVKEMTSGVRRALGKLSDTSVVKGFKTMFSGLGDIAKKGASKVKSAIGGIGKKLKSMSNPIKKVTKGFSKLANTFKRVLMYKAISQLFQAVRSAINEGVGNVYQWSSLMGGSLASSLDQVATSMEYFKNSIGAAVAPLIETFAPVIDMIVDKIVALINVINQLFSSLTGKGTFIKANKQATKFAESVNGSGSAVDKLKGSLAGFDEITNIGKDTSASGGASAKDFGSMFEQAEISSDIKNFADQLKEAFNNGDWENLGKLLGGKINDIFNGIKWDSIGSKLGEGLNGAITTWYNMIKETDFVNIAIKISTMFNNALYKIDFNTIGRTVVQKFTKIGDLIIGALWGIDWKQVGKSISDFLMGMMDEAFDWLNKYDWEQLGSDLWQALKDLFEGIDWLGLAQKLFELLVTALKAAAEGLWSFIKTMCKDLLDLFKEKFGIHSPSTEMDDIGQNLVAGLMQGLDHFSDVADKIKEWAGKVVEWFTKGEDGKGIIEHFKDIGSNIVSGFKEKIESKYGDTKSPVSNWATSVKNWFSKDGGVNSTTWRTNADNILTGFRTKISTSYTNNKSSITTWGNQVKTWFTDKVNKSTFYGYARNVIDGFKNGINDLWYTTKSAISNWADGIRGWFSSKMQIHSPSRLFYDFGVNTIAGYNNAISDLGGSSKKVMSKWADGVIATVPSLSLAMDTSSLDGYDLSSINGTIGITRDGSIVVDNSDNDTNALLETLINAVDNINMNPYITVKDVGDASIKYIKQQTRLLGKPVV